MKNDFFDKLFDSIYQNKKQIFIYFICALICSVFRSAMQIVASAVTTSGAAIIAWTLWAIVFYPLLKRFVFRYKANDIFYLLRQIIIYIICASLVYFAYQTIVSLLFMISSANPTVSLALGGALSEIVCILLMWFVAFSKKLK